MSSKEKSDKGEFSELTKEILDNGSSIIDLAYASVGVAETIPILSTAISLLKARDKYMHYRVRRNISAFTKAFNQSDIEKCRKINDYLFEEDERRENFVDVFLDVIVEAGRPLKAEITGNLLSSLADEKITYEEYEMLSLLVAEAAVSALTSVPRHFESVYQRLSGIKSEKIEYDHHPNLVRLGLMSLNSMPQRINKNGVLLYVHGFRGSHEKASVVFERKFPSSS